MKKTFAQIEKERAKSLRDKHRLIEPGRSELLRALVGISDQEQMSPDAMVQRLESEGYRIVKDDPAWLKEDATLIRSAATRRWEGGKTVKFGVVSDTQLGSRKQQLTFLREVYQRFEDKGIDTVLHPGDLCDGDGRVYPGQQFDLFVHGYERQLNYIIENYPRRNGIKTHVIAGNHDWSFWQHGGADILAAMAKARDDIVYEGYAGASVDLEGIKIYLIHLSRGQTYARSYRLQKVIEQFAPQQKPDFLFAGDKHSWAHLPMYRNVWGYQCGCFQAQTDHERRMGLYPEIGALIVEVDYGTAGADKRDTEKVGHDGRQAVVAVRHELLPFYIPLENDY